MDQVGAGALVYARGDTEGDRRAKMVAAIERLPVYWLARRSVKEMCMRQSVADTQADAGALLEASPMACQLRSLIYVLDRAAQATLEMKTAGDADLYEPLEFVEAVRLQWDTRMRYQLRAFAAQQKRPLIAPRSKSSAARDDVAEPFPAHLVFSWADLLSDLENLVNPNATATFSNLKGFGLIKLSLKTPSLATLRERYRQLSPDVRHVGLDDELAGLEWFRNQRYVEGERLLNDAQTTVADLMRYAQTGVPASLRPRFWKRILGVWTSDRDVAYYERLITQVRRWELITDDLYRLEVQETTDNAAYFVFEDMLDEIMLAFSRDSWLPKNSTLPLCLAPLTTNVFSEAAVPGRDDGAGYPFADANGKLSPSLVENSGIEIDDQGTATIPPCGVVPFHHQVMLAAPLCYLFQRCEHTYFVFRHMYARYFCRLHTISSRPGTILHLCKLFEDLVQSRSPQVFYHAVEVGMPPLRVVFPWLFTAFSGYLAVDQVLTLWDRILAYDSLELLAILASAIFLFRSKSVLNATSSDEIRDIFEDGIYFRVMPLLQHFLFDSSR
ncbi:Rab-GAP TBC domain-containing protein [Plasmodiophora brassicae]|uniref:Rab-GAP TBC domain-containing protein n=1 Tax=Plasmodiophora brassicae TaxID=37360 RepID=A0A0G4ISX4_PLABS|nr:hypothetical protein PBRA_006310 [Plasmodiophora brassicae]SPQ95235.1 unnamed protein product [Plasmodiophora brassicae]